MAELPAHRDYYAQSVVGVGAVDGLLNAVDDVVRDPVALDSAFDCFRGCCAAEPRSCREIRQISDLDWIL